MNTVMIIEQAKRGDLFIFFPIEYSGLVENMQLGLHYIVERKKWNNNLLFS
jgi:hypothetical protein